MNKLLTIVLSTLAVITTLFLFGVIDQLAKGTIVTDVIAAYLNIVAMIPTAIAIGFAARRRNRSFIKWFALSCLLFGIAYIVLRHVHYRYPVSK